MEHLFKCPSFTANPPEIPKSQGCSSSSKTLQSTQEEGGGEIDHPSSQSTCSAPVQVGDGDRKQKGHSVSITPRAQSTRSAPVHDN